MRHKGQAKPTGTCSVCFSQFKVQDSGRIHDHGPRDTRCPGSGRPPAGAAGQLVSAAGGNQALQDSSIHGSLSGVPSGSQTPMTQQATTSSYTPFGENRVRLVEHIPKSARNSCATLLSSILRDICDSPDTAENWENLLKFGPNILAKPPRGGKKAQLSSLINKRVSSFKSDSSHSTTETPPPTLGPRKQRKQDPENILATAVTSKIEAGNLRAAVRLLCSSDKPASNSQETLNSLEAKHPKSHPNRRDIPEPVTDSLEVDSGAVLAAVRSFPNGSSGGMDGTRPQHIRDMLNCKEAEAELIAALTNFVNILLSGVCPVKVQPFFFGGRLLALAKKDGGIRPIAVGLVWRRLAAKCANIYATEATRGLLCPRQLGVGVPGGAEAAVHVARKFLDSLQPGHVMVKLDFCNAFNSLRRDSMLDAVKQEVPLIFNFCRLSYASSSHLQYEGHFISSEEGPQQGDPLGPLLFSLTAHPILTSLNSDIIMGYLDDFTICGEIDMVARDVGEVYRLAGAMGLTLNASKCEVITDDNPVNLPDIFRNFLYFKPDQASLLGAPILVGSAMDTLLSKRCDDLQRAIDRFGLISAHDALLILKNALGSSKMLYMMRASPCSNHPALTRFDNLQRSALGKISNSCLSDLNWIQASLPVKNGGLGIRSVAMLAPSAFLASAAATQSIQYQILPTDFPLIDRLGDLTRDIWLSRHSGEIAPLEPECAKQKSWDAASIKAGSSLLFGHFTDPHHTARLLACQAPHSGDWLNAWPISSCGLRLDDEAIRVAIGLRLGVNLCAPHVCPCGTLVDAGGTHGLSCRRSSARIIRHGLINDLVYRAFVKAKIPASKEPLGLNRVDGKRPDGSTLIPWDGKCLTWDVTVPDTFAASHLQKTSRVAGGAAEEANTRKCDKYANIMLTHDFCAIACETMGPINESGLSLLKKLGHEISKATGDPRETAFLLQRLSIIIQRGNSMAFSNSFREGEGNDS